MSSQLCKQMVELDVEAHSQNGDDAYLTTSTSIPSTRRYLEKREKVDLGTKSKWPSLIAVSLVLSWMTLSSGLILSNKYVMDTLGFRFPITLTCWHFVFTSMMTQILGRATPLIDSRKEVKMTGRTYLRAIVPVSILYCGSLVCSNLPYLTLSVAFIQMLKGVGPAAVLFATTSLGLSAPTHRTWINILIIMAGVTAASYGEIRFVLSGFLYQMGGIFFEAYRLALIQKLLSSAEQKMDPLVSLYYYTPICAAMIAVVAFIDELPSLSIAEVLNVGLWKLIGNAAMAFLLNVASVMLIGKTSALVLMLCGTLKNILLIIASVIIWGTEVAPLQILGHSITTVALVYYSLGPEMIHSFFCFLRKGSMEEGQPKVVSKRRFGKRKIAMILVVFAAMAGGIGGVVAGYNVKWDPRLYWYSVNTFSD